MIRFMGQVIPFRKPYHARRGRGRKARFAPDGVMIFNLVALVFLAVWLLPQSWIERTKPISLSASVASDTEVARFGYCHQGGGNNCVVDGDTFYYRGQKIRIADIDTPETHPPRCTEEARLGEAATRRLRELLNAGPFSLQSVDRDEDSYGRKLRTVMRGGESLGGQLVRDGLARYYQGGRQPWC
jgi:micrococcal nuclease